MRIAVMGAGGVGGNLGARLAAAGEDVALVARGAHLAAIRRDGLRVTSRFTGDLHVRPRIATDDPAAVGPVDVVLLAVKLYDLEEATALCRPMLGPDTAVISLLNGVDAAERMAPIVGQAHVVPGVAYTTANIDAPGLIRHVSGPHLIGFGEIAGGRSARLDAFDAVARRAGIETDYVERVDVLLWRKFTLLVAVAGACAVARRPMGEVRRDPELHALYTAASDEAIEVGVAKGIDVSESREAIETYLQNAAEDLKPSLLVDLERGRRLEVDWLAGAVVRLGREAGVATPVNHTIWASLRPHAAGAPG